MSEKLALIWPELILFATTCVVMLTGQWPVAAVRRLTPWLVAVGLLGAGGASLLAPPGDGMFPGLMGYAKLLTAGIGLMMLPLLIGTVDRNIEALSERGVPFQPIRSNGAEFYAFFLFSLTGLMLVSSADDLIWLFLALELTSLPTYIMVTISTQGTRSQEAGIKYFFLGALGAAIFLYGFALLYGAAGTTDIPDIAAYFSANGIGSIGLLGILISLIGVAFKVAAVPMHFYTPDVYQGAASPVSAMLAFVPKAAGFLAIFLIAGIAGWGEDGRLPAAVDALLWIMAALTMTVGNVLALLQSSVKRMMAYSSVAHSGYMLVGVLAGPGIAGADAPFWQNGLAAVLFYLLCYGVMNLGVFGVLASLERRGEEADEIDDIRGLVRTVPHLGWVMILCSLSLLGFPPLLGFIGKIGLFTSGIASNNLPLVLILGLNSAIAAFYYLRLVGAVYFEPASDTGFRPSPYGSRHIASLVSAAGVIALLFIGNGLIRSADKASRLEAPAAVPAASGSDSDHEAEHG
ncbi:MAG: NADH-quinone oxidoreductase subunit N [Planctomycetota bacterium]